MTGYRKFGLAGLLVAAALADKNYTAALIALGIYSLGNIAEHIWGG